MRSIKSIQFHSHCQETCHWCNRLQMRLLNQSECRCKSTMIKEILFLFTFFFFGQLILITTCVIRNTEEILLLLMNEISDTLDLPHSHLYGLDLSVPWWSCRILDQRWDWLPYIYICISFTILIHWKTKTKKIGEHGLFFMGRGGGFRFYHHFFYFTHLLLWCVQRH